MTKSAHQALEQMSTSIAQATTSAKTASAELVRSCTRMYHGAMLALCGAALIAGFACGVMFHEWRTPPAESVAATAGGGAAALPQSHPC